MNDRQKKNLHDAFHMLAAAAQRGRRMVDDGATLQEIEIQALAVAEVAEGIKSAIKSARAAEALLAKTARPGLRIVR